MMNAFSVSMKQKLMGIISEMSLTPWLFAKSLTLNEVNTNCWRWIFILPMQLEP
nr:hypothetical protein [Sedimentibacter sp.]